MRHIIRNLVIAAYLCVWSAVDAVGQNNATAAIDRQAVVCRNNPEVTSLDTLASLTLGNGHFAFTVDATGLQTFPTYYANGVPLGTMSDWGWHAFPNSGGFRPEEAWVERDFGRGHKELYAAEFRTEGRQRDAANYLRQNPHRAHLGCLGFAFADPQLVMDAKQVLDLWNGLVDSRFRYGSRAFHVQTVCSPSADMMATKVEAKGKIDLLFRVPYPTGRHSDDGCDWREEAPQRLTLRKHANAAWVDVSVDDMAYQVRFSWKGHVGVRMGDDHTVVVSGRNDLELTVQFVDSGMRLDSRLGLDPRALRPRRTARRKPYENEDSVRVQQLRADGQEDKRVVSTGRTFSDVRAEAARFWQNYWNEGGMADFSHVADPRAAELERRVVLSQYLLAVNDGGSTPPQETGLTYNSWFGKFHLEMIWWHQAQFALWGHPRLLERSLDWYFKAAPNAREIAKRQGFKGIRWMKMTDPEAGEAPSNVGSYLIWQQPHVIYLAELLYRCQRDEAGRQRMLDKFGELVDETALFMGDFASYDEVAGRYVLKGCIPAQETLKADSTVNPPLELSYWHWGLSAAQQWRERAGKARRKEWDDVIAGLSPLASADSLYLAAETASDTYTNIRFTSDHPAVTGAYGMLPACPLVDEGIMRNTLHWVLRHWNWDKTWGWDYPMVAMCAARLGEPENAVDALLMPCRTNTYLPDGHNYQDGRLRAYLPGNGGLLTAVAMMLAGWDGSSGVNPGFPSDWDVRWEGILPMP